MGKRGPQAGTGGRRKTPLNDKILEGKNNLTVIEFPELPEPEALPTPPEFLSEATKDMGKWPTAQEIFEGVTKWLERTGCVQFISKDLITEYALLKARFFACEVMNSKVGLLAKHPTTGQPIQSPYVAMSLQYLKAADSTWTKIWQVVEENSRADYKHGNPDEDMMEALLSRRK